MGVFSAEFINALIFSGAAILIVGLSAWWLYLSPMDAPLGGSQKASPRLAAWIVVLLSLSMFQLVTGAWWDASMHLLTGEIPAGADFLWPPHIMIYSSFLLSFAVAGISLGIVARQAIQLGMRDPRQWVRHNPYLGAVALSSVYGIISIPGDVIWHELFGIDLTAWSPPHLFLGIASCVLAISALGLFLSATPRGGLRTPHQWAMMVLLGLVLSFGYLLGVIEWELPGIDNPHVLARPIWMYPMVGGVAAFVALALASRLVAMRWAATGTALVFYALRFATMAGLEATGNVLPFTPLWFLLGALLMDVVNLPHLNIPPSWRGYAQAAAFTLGYAVVSLPLLALRRDLPPHTAADTVKMIAFSLLLVLAVVPVVNKASGMLLGHDNARQTATPA